jgi:hypothetical protein
MLEKIAGFLLAVAGPLAAYALRYQRRHRLQSQARSYLKLGEELEPHDPASAKRLRDLVADIVIELVQTERRSLGRRFEPTTIFAAALFLLPSAIVLVLIWPIDAAWEWLATAGAAFWALVVFAAAWQTAWKSRGEETV